jgi:hypothetical protein
MDIELEAVADELGDSIREFGVGWNVREFGVGWSVARSRQRRAEASESDR